MNFDIAWKKYEICIEPLLFWDLDVAFYEQLRENEPMSMDLVKPKHRLFNKDFTTREKMFDKCCDITYDYILWMVM